MAKDKFIGCWVTDEELAQIEAEMFSIDYLSKSKYIRMKVLNEKLPVVKGSISDKGLRKSINVFTSSISKFLSNYNQTVRNYNNTCRLTKKNGDPVINTKATIFYIQKLDQDTKEIVKKQQEIIELINKIISPEQSL